MSKTWFYRKGIIGDWKTHLTREMNSTMDRIIKIRLESSGLQHIYDMPDVEKNSGREELVNTKQMIA